MPVLRVIKSAQDSAFQRSVELRLEIKTVEHMFASGAGKASVKLQRLLLKVSGLTT